MEGISIPDGVVDAILEKSQRSMRRALLMLEACNVAQYVLVNMITSLQ